MHLICESSLLEKYLCEQEFVDYSHYTQPHPKVVKALQEHTNCLHLCQHFLPNQL